MLSCSALNLGYQGTPVIATPTITIADKEHCLILGPSGSGKTTLLYAIAGLIQPLHGQIQLNGQDLWSLTAAQRDRLRGAQMGIVFQTLHLVEALSVLDNLLLAQYAAGFTCDIAHAKAQLTAVNMNGYAKRKPAELSQGERQRLAIARATINRPSLIICDEPTSALDDAHCEQVMQLLLASAAQSGASLIIATHDARIKRHIPKQLTVGASV
ncbi:MAG: ATP-binding cassette domain-containing protein [Rickettsiales bacterium]|nr:ATP-binding cassette domain-containing protein [Rickettsiales bacterium]